jgi:hypothetical protein
MSEQETYSEQQARKLRRETIFCEMCQRLHRWKKATGSEYKPAEQNDQES